MQAKGGCAPFGVEQWQIQWVQSQGRGPRFQQIGHAADVVKVGVGQQHRVQLPTALIQRS